MENIVLKLFDELQLPYTLYGTTESNHAFYLARDIFRREHSSVEPLQVIVVGGDGTTQEFIDGAVYSATACRKLVDRVWDLIILPFGTVSDPLWCH